MNRNQRENLAFQRKTLGYEKAFLKFLRNFIFTHSEEIVSLAQKKDWEGLEKLVLKLEPDIKRRLLAIYEQFGNDQFESLNA